MNVIPGALCYLLMHWHSERKRLGIICGIPKSEAAELLANSVTIL
jgi:hypothetical protein